MAAEAQPMLAHASPGPGPYPGRTGPLWPPARTRSNGNPLQQPPPASGYGDRPDPTVSHTVDNIAHRTSSASSMSPLDRRASAPQQRHLPSGALPGPSLRQMPATQQAVGHVRHWSSSVDSLASSTTPYPDDANGQVHSNASSSAPQPHGAHHTFYRHPVPAQASPALPHREYSMRETTNRQSFRPYPDRRGHFPLGSTMHPSVPSSATPPRPHKWDSSASKPRCTLQRP